MYCGVGSMWVGGYAASLVRPRTLVYVYVCLVMCAELEFGDTRQ